MRRREGTRLDVWLAQVHKSGLAELQRCAQGVEQDKAAVQAGLTLPLRNGQVEGQVTRIKLIKRMMYGRASFPLLRQRVLHALSAQESSGMERVNDGLEISFLSSSPRFFHAS